jgi:PIN domain nuclease of toxin-antitoxin system
MTFFVLDACALIAHFARENGADNVKNILKQAIDDENTKVYMNKINLLEVYYDVIKVYNEQEAKKCILSGPCHPNPLSWALPAPACATVPATR